MAGLVHPFTVNVIAEVIGIPSSDRSALTRWAQNRTRGAARLDAKERVAHADRAATEFEDYFDQLIAYRRRRPGSDLLSALVARELTGSDVSATCIHVLSAGHLPTAGLLGNVLLAQVRNPRVVPHWQRGPRGPLLEDLIRRLGPVRWVPKVAANGLVLEGVGLPRGDIVLLSLAEANLDHHVFPSSRQVRVRPQNPHVAFGAGPHRCLGARLARRELHVLLTSWAAVPANLSLSDAERDRAEGGALSVLPSLHVQTEGGETGRGTA